MKLLTVDLERPLPDVPPPTVGEQWILVRLHREPLGTLHLVGHGCTAAELADMISDRLGDRIMRHVVADNLGAADLPSPGTFGDCPRRVDVDLPPLTVAVCTRDGAGRLAECLDALQSLRYPAGRLDLIVVDNAPRDDSTRRLVTANYPAIRYVVEPRPGLNWARNRAVLESRGDLVAFTDDDVSVDEWWADAIGSLFALEPDVEAVTGLVVPDEMDADAQRLFERYGGFGRGYTRQYFRVNIAAGEPAARRHGGSGKFGTGANMAFRRTMFDRIGLFDPALDVGTPTNGGGDLEMFFRVLKEGGTLVYEPAAIVRHRHRRSYAALRTQLANNGVGFYAYLVRTARAYQDERPALFRLGAWWLWRWNVRRLVRSFVRHDFPRDLILAELRGSFSGLRRYAPATRQAASIAASFGPQQPYVTVGRDPQSHASHASTANGASSCPLSSTGP